MFNVSFDWGGGLILPSFFINIFTAQTRHFQGFLRVWSREHQVQGLPWKIGYMLHWKKNQKINLFNCFHKQKRVDRITPPPIKTKVKRVKTCIATSACYEQLLCIVWEWSTPSTHLVVLGLIRITKFVILSHMFQLGGQHLLV